MGVQLIGKDVSLISSIGGIAKASISSVGGVTGWAGGGGFQPGDFDFVNGSTPYTSNTVTFTKSGKLCISGLISAGQADMEMYCYTNSYPSVAFYNTTTTAEANEQNDPNNSDGNLLTKYAVVPVSIGDTMYFIIGAQGPGSTTATVEIRSNSFSGTLIDTFTITYAGCYLTTATVQFKGLLDNGPELTAMRALREHYRGDVYYDNLIDEYYTNSQIIIDGINNSTDPSVDYEYIYQSVLKVKDFVDNNQWEEAKDEYISTYLTLKAKYITSV